jgi:hypothetical protein
MYDYDFISHLDFAGIVLGGCGWRLLLCSNMASGRVQVHTVYIQSNIAQVSLVVSAIGDWR